METVLVISYFSCILLCVLCLLFLSSYLMFLNPQAARRRSIRKQAKVDYQNARGTSHLSMLRDARSRTNMVIRQYQQELSRAQKQSASLQKEQQDRLRDALEKHIAYDRLTEVDGIGPKLRDRILSATFRSRITDLEFAGRVQGVGASRQQAINRWIQDYENRIDALLDTDFPGKKAIRESYQGKSRNLENHINNLNARCETMNEHLKRLQLWIEKLEKVQVDDFVKALEKPTNAPEVLNDHLDDYIKGVFAEWEPVPKWFKELIAAEAE